MGEAAGDHDRVDVGETRLRVPHQLGLRAELLDRPGDVELAVRAGEDDDANVHGLTRCEPEYPARGRSFTVTVYASITGLLRSRRLISST